MTGRGLSDTPNQSESVLYQNQPGGDCDRGNVLFAGWYAWLKLRYVSILQPLATVILAFGHSDTHSPTLLGHRKRDFDTPFTHSMGCPCDHGMSRTASSVRGRAFINAQSISDMQTVIYSGSSTTIKYRLEDFELKKRTTSSQRSPPRKKPLSHALYLCLQLLPSHLP